jgi:hypothetical protein
VRRRSNGSLRRRRLAGRWGSLQRRGSERRNDEGRSDKMSTENALHLREDCRETSGQGLIRHRNRLCSRQKGEQGLQGRLLLKKRGGERGRGARGDRRRR